MAYREAVTHAIMSAASQSLGLAQSQQVKPEYLEYEDPARSWIDLHLAFAAGDPAKVREVLAVAKASHWTHELFSEACKAGDDPDYSEEDGSGPDEEWDSDFVEE